MTRRGQRFAPSPTMVREAYAKAINPDEAARPVERLRDMSPEKIAELEKLYGAKVVPRAPRPRTRLLEEVTLLDRKMTDYHPKCPNKNCDHHMKLREAKKSKYGPSVFYGCEGYPTCKTTWSTYDDGRPRGEPSIK